MDICTYCGTYSGNTRDHVIPAAYTSIIKNFSCGQIVPCCSKCNTLLGSKMYLTVPERAEFLFKRYKEKYRAILTFPDWSKDELEEMSVTFQRLINSAIRKREEFTERLNHLDIVRNGFQTPDNYD